MSSVLWHCSLEHWRQLVKHITIIWVVIQLERIVWKFHGYAWKTYETENIQQNVLMDGGDEATSDLTVDVVTVRMNVEQRCGGWESDAHEMSDARRWDSSSDLLIDLTFTTVLRPFFQDHPGEPVPEENFWTLWCKGRLTEADTPTIRLGATPSGLTSAHLHHPPIFSTGLMRFCCPTNSVKALKAICLT